MNKIEFSDIYSEFYPKITHYLTRLVGEHEAEDVAQIVFEKINSNLSDFNKIRGHNTDFHCLEIK